MHQTAFPVPVQYDYAIVRKFVIMALVWGVLGMSAGVYIAAQLAFPALHLDIAQITFGRLRPVHTTLMIFGFAGSALFAASYYIVQRTCQARLASSSMANMTFWGWQVSVLLGVIGYMNGITQGMQFAEFPWYLDILIAVTWAMYLMVFVLTLRRRSPAHIYVANWFFLAFILATAMLHVLGNLAVPVGLFNSSSYSMHSGAQDAMVQWWYGHNLVGFFLTAAFLGMMYYIVPKQAGRPIYSYRLSIMHFWALSLMYLWLGGQHLHWTAQPDWITWLAAGFSILLLLAVWGGMINGIMTLSGAWHRLRTDPILLFLITALWLYGLATLEASWISVQRISVMAHYSEWTFGQGHSGVLGWVAMITFGSLYHLVPRLWETRLYSLRLVYLHFWLATIGIALYVASIWVADIGQRLMLRAFDEYGDLAYGFIETVVFMHWPLLVRMIGGIFLLAGFLVMIFNIGMTLARARAERAALAAKPAQAAG